MNYKLRSVHHNTFFNRVRKATEGRRASRARMPSFPLSPRSRLSSRGPRAVRGREEIKVNTAGREGRDGPETG